MGLQNYIVVCSSSECDKGRHGEGCTQTCSEHCAGEDNPCHHVNGTCDLGCSRGYRGALCTEGDSQNFEVKGRTGPMKVQN